MIDKRSFSLAIAALLLLFVLLVPAADGFAQEPVLASPEQQQKMMAWIPSSCCVTNNCCFEVPSSELQSLENDRWRVIATGQILNRTDWSHNGRHIRCACDFVNGAWRVHRNAVTRCVFPILQSARSNATAAAP